MKCLIRNLCEFPDECCFSCNKAQCKMRCYDNPKNCIYLEDKELNNKKIGSDFENRFCEYLRRNGYWVHFMNPAPNGSQPFDILAVKGLQNGMAIVCAFDCKTLKGDRFPLGRIEDNQEMAFAHLNNCGVHNTYFAIEREKNKVIYLPSQEAIKAKENGEKSIDLRCRVESDIEQ